ncbi:MAG: AI-2E family transporter [Clostridiales bacterium]|nr:AI-2E family transporter [Clostridiales bacterium]
MKKFRWDKKYLYTGVTAFCVVACSVIFFFIINNWSDFRGVLRKIQSSISPVIIGLALAYLLRPGLNTLERRILRPLGTKLFKGNDKKTFAFARSIGITIMILLMLVVVAGVIRMVLPQIYLSVEKLIMSIDHYIEVVVEWADKYLSENPEMESSMSSIISEVLKYLADWLQTGVLGRIDTIIVSVTSGLRSVIMSLFNFCIGIIISVYVLYSKEKFAAQAKKVACCFLQPKNANGLLEAFRKADEVFAGFFIGKLLDSAIIGVICGIFTAAVNMPYAALVSVVVGVTNIVPFFGPYFGAVPCAFIILLESPMMCLVFIIFCIVLQTFDGHILGPKILGSKTNLSSFWVIFAILLSGGLFGFIGMICGVPVFAVIYYFFQRAVRRRLEEKGMPVDTRDYMELDMLDEESSELIMKAPEPREKPPRAKKK